MVSRLHNVYICREGGLNSNATFRIAEVFGFYIPIVLFASIISSNVSSKIWSIVQGIYCLSQNLCTPLYVSNFKINGKSAVLKHLQMLFTLRKWKFTRNRIRQYVRVIWSTELGPTFGNLRRIYAVFTIWRIIWEYVCK